MASETSDLPTSSRPPPAGQDSAEVSEDYINLSARKSTNFKQMESTANGTPRRCTLPGDFMPLNKPADSRPTKFIDETGAPLGFEPEGSVTAQPFYERWRLDLIFLLEDSEGRRVFRDFLLREGHEILFDCWLACQDFKSLIPDSSRVSDFAKEFYRKFIAYRDPRIKIRDQTRNNVDHCFRTHSISTRLYDEVELDVIEALRNPWFDRFISSDFFKRFYENGKKLNQFDAQEQNKHTFQMLSVPEECSLDSFPSTQNVQRSNEMCWPANRQSQHGAVERASSQGRIPQAVGGLSPYRFTTGVPATSQNDSEMQSLSSDALTDCDRISTADSLATDLSDPTKSRRDQHHRSRNHGGPRDNLPTLAHFKPRTQRMNSGMKPMKPEEFARTLTEKLEKVLKEREQAEADEVETASSLQYSSNEQNVQTSNSGSTLQNASSNSRHSIPSTKADRDINPSESGKSCSAYSDRYSVAGKSSASGSEPIGNVEKYKRGAKELVSTVHHALRTELRECRCPQCYEAQFIASSRDSDYIVHHQHYHKNYNGHESMAEFSCVQHTNHCSCCRHSQESSMHHSSRPQMELNGKLTAMNLGQLQPDPPPIVDRSRILNWMEQNEKYQHESFQPPLSPKPSPAMHRRQKEPVTYNTSRPPVPNSGHVNAGQPIASDPNMPPLPQPDSNTVLEEVKRRLEDGKKDRSSRSRHGRSRSSRSQHHQTQMYMDPAYTERAMSTTSGHWSLSDTASSSSNNRVPSVASSSIPSSASRIWNESKNDARSHSDIHSQSNAPTHCTRSHGSGSSKGRTKDGTVVTYFFPLEPIPYRTRLKGKNVTLGDFKALLSKKGNFRYYFKTHSEDVGVVWEELLDDSELLPLYQDKVVGKIDKIE